MDTYSEKLVRRQILRARKLKRDDLLDRAPIDKDSKLVLNVTYHPAHSKVNVLSDSHLLLTPNKEHRMDFHNVLVFKCCKRLKDILVRARLPTETKGSGERCTCGGERCGVTRKLYNTLLALSLLSYQLVIFLLCPLQPQL